MPTGTLAGRYRILSPLHVLGEFYALEAMVNGLALLGEREQRGALYPLTLEFLKTGHAFSGAVVGPSSPHLSAALAAGAAGLVDKSHEHFEAALRGALEMPFRVLQPTVRYWYGRALSASGKTDDRSRGRAILDAALADFRALEMVLHAPLAEKALRRDTT
jgi:hypothetical protein